jgi:hypothetical protein
MPRHPELKKPTSVISEKRRRAYLRALARGRTAEEISCKLAPNNERQRRRIRGQIRWLAATDEEFQTQALARSQGASILELEEITDALIRRAKRGRVDAAKFLMEFSGAHNPKIQHEHSGEVKVSLNMNVPRPERVPNPTELEEAIPDAEVVEE